MTQRVSHGKQPLKGSFCDDRWTGVLSLKIASSHIPLQQLYTLVMTDPGVLDIKTLRGPQQSAWQWLHWIVVNVPGEKAVPAAGQVLQPYGQPAPPAGNHRYTFILFEQKAGINPAVPKGRDAFDTRAFAIANGLTPIGGFYFLAGPETAQ